MSGDVSSIHRKDTKDVHVISTAFSPTSRGTVKRMQKDESAITVSCPQMVFEYTARMAGVERLDTA